MKIKNFQKNPGGVEIPNFLMKFRNKRIYVSDCQEIIRNYKNDIKRLAKRSIIHYYLSGKSAVPIDLIVKLSREHPEILDRCFEKTTTFASRANQGHKLPKKVTQELAYFLGCLRDGSIYKYRLTISQKESGKKWLEFLIRLCEKEFNLSPKMRKYRNVYEIRISSKPLVSFLQEVFGMPVNQQIWKTPKIIEENQQLWKYYISGFFDAEGHCTKPETFRKTGKKKISFHQNNLNSLEFIKNALNTLGLKQAKYSSRKTESVMLYISSQLLTLSSFTNCSIRLENKMIWMPLSVHFALETPKLVPLEMNRSSASPEIGRGVEILIE